MSDLDQELLADFLRESFKIVDECETLLEDIESDSSQASRLAEFSNKIDRIMGAAKSLAMLTEADHPLHIIGDVTALCKALGERGSHGGADPLFTTTVAFLLDAVEITRSLLEAAGEPDASSAGAAELKNALVGRVSWIAEIYRGLPKGMLDEKSDKLGQNEIDALMKKLGDG